MPKPDNTDALAATIRDLEDSNATLAQRLAELTSEGEARDATVAQLLAAAEQRDADLASAAREIEGLHEELRRRSSSAPLAFNITALLDLHRIVGSDSDRYLATARRLGDALVAQLAASDPG